MRSPPADIFVWGMHPETTPDDIVKDLSECGINVEPKDIVRKSKDEAPRLSFKISVRAEDLQKALNPSIWPLRVKVREYIYYPKKKPTDSNNDTNSRPQQNAAEQQVPGITLISSGSNVNPATPLPLFNKFSSLAVEPHQA